MTLRVWPRHLYSVPDFNGGTGYCAQGARFWFAAHGFSWVQFVEQGIDAEVLLATGDPLAARAVEHARNLEAQHGQEE